MNFNEQFMQNAIVRINELQNEIKRQYKSIEGAQQYVARQVALYREDVALRNKYKSIEAEGEKIANAFFSQNATMIDALNKRFEQSTSDSKK